MRALPRLAPSALALAALLLPACASFSTEGRSASALATGQTWLVDHQNADGSWGGESDVGRPDEVFADGNLRGAALNLAQGAGALAAQALAQPAARGDAQALAALQKAVAWQLGHPTQLRSAPQAFYNVWAYAYRIEMFLTVDRLGLLPEQRAAMRAAAQTDIQHLCDLQSADGGFAYYDFERPMSPATGHETTSFCSAVAVRAMMRAKQAGLAVPQERIDAVTAVLRRCRLSDTAFAYSRMAAGMPGPSATAYGAAGRTCLCHLALADAGDPASAAALPAALASYRANHGAIMAGAGRTVPHQAPGAIAGYYTWFSHYYGMQTAARLGDRATADWMAGEISDHQGSAGYWFDFPIPCVGRTYATAFAVLALQERAGMAAH